MPLDLVASFAGGGLIGTIAWWLETGLQRPAGEVAEDMVRLITVGVYGAMQISLPQ